MKAIFTTALLLSLVSYLAGQQKPPEVGNDYATILAGDTISINVMLNDWCMEGHTMKIFNILQGEGGVCAWVDSTLTYSSFFFFSGIDSVGYRLIDETNGLFSGEGFLIITTQNFGRGKLDVNNIDATFNSFGYQFCTLPNHISEFNVPKGNGTSSIFCYSLWMGGLDDGGQLHFAGERYRIMGTDYFPGPVSETYLNSQYIDWNLVSLVSRDDIEIHKAHWWEAGYEPGENILNWPAHGDVSLGQAEYLAPFYDQDADGYYNPLAGDYPFMRGDVAIWNVYNDDLAPHTESDGERVGAEIHQLGYAFDCPEDSIFKNALFIRYNIINRSANAYHDFYLTSFVDFDLGYPWDDFVGCDTLLNCFFAYNGDEEDEDDSFFGITLGYGFSPPAQAVVFLNHSLSSFIATNNFNNITSDPLTPEGYYNIMNGLWRGGEPITYGGTGFGGDIPVSYQFPGDPLAPEEWSEVSAANNPDDRRGIGSVGPFEVPAGDTLMLDIAFLYARDYAGDNLSSVTLLKERVAELKWYYDNDSTPCGKTWSSTGQAAAAAKNWIIYPNPVTNFLHLEVDAGDREQLKYRISDLAGKTVMSDALISDKEAINTSRLSKGVYIIEITGGGDVIKDKFIKK